MSRIRTKSLAFRLVLAAAAWALVALIVTAVVLSSLYRKSVERSFDTRLNVYLTSLIASSAQPGEEALDPAGALGETLFDLPFSGWYWQITPLDADAKPALTSKSLADEQLALPSRSGIKANEKLSRQSYGPGPDGQRLRVVEREIAFGDSGRFSYAVAGNSADIDDEISNFNTLLFVALSLLGVGLVAATVFQVRYGLRPLHVLSQQLAAIRSGTAERLEGEYPAEIVPLARELNALIQSNRDVIERARTHVGNLAHALKTPLSVITNEARKRDSALSAKVTQQAVIMRDQVNHHLERARMAARIGVIGAVTEIEPVVRALVRVLGRIHADQGIVIDMECPHGLKFQGEKQDLEEMIGNLLENACKWADSQVQVTVTGGFRATGDTDSVVILVDDDGPGLSEGEIDSAVQRGQRLDESVPGTGLGLSIVRELADLYKGQLTMERAPAGGLRARLKLPRS